MNVSGSNQLKREPEAAQCVRLCAKSNHCFARLSLMFYRAPLDWLNFFLADVRGGLGAYVGVFLLTHAHWNQATIGAVLTLSGLIGIHAKSIPIKYTKIRRLTAAVFDLASQMDCLCNWCGPKSSACYVARFELPRAIRCGCGNRT